MATREPATTPRKCRSCSQDILWVVWPKTGKKMPVDAVPDMRPPPKGGKIVLAYNREADELRAEMFRPEHGPKRNRFTSHFTTCPNANEHRGSR